MGASCPQICQDFDDLLQALLDQWADFPAERTQLLMKEYLTTE